MQKLDNDYLEASRNAHFDKAREIVIDYDRVKVAVETALKSPSFTGSQRCFIVTEYCSASLSGAIAIVTPPLRPISAIQNGLFFFFESADQIQESLKQLMNLASDDSLDVVCQFNGCTLKVTWFCATCCKRCCNKCNHDFHKGKFVGVIF